MACMQCQCVRHTADILDYIIDAMTTRIKQVSAQETPNAIDFIDHDEVLYWATNLWELRNSLKPYKRGTRLLQVHDCDHPKCTAARCNKK